ncbi:MULTISPECIES: hypothetical protein [Salimicrobium]|nr:MULTISPECIES: hypothetical protein [Salimicrobium]MBM7695592.1 hypothetical protein [Salimicrobium jeotgali]
MVDVLLSASSHSLSGGTWFWMFVPMPLLIILSLITLFTEGSK